jgi:hypothetical protein
MSDAVKKGWTGGELIPGIGFTDTGKYGLSGKSFARNAPVVAGTGLGGLVGAGRFAVTTPRKGYRMGREAFLESARFGGRAPADLLGSKFFSKERKERGEIPLRDIPRKLQALSQKSVKKP